LVKPVGFLSKQQEAGTPTFRMKGIDSMFFFAKQALSAEGSSRLTMHEEIVLQLLAQV
jgi:hypothetical protein